MSGEIDLDGRIGEGWGGVKPNGSHINVVLGRRGTPTAAALLGTLTTPSPGHTPILVVVGPTEQEYEPVWPPTIMINKATALEERHQTLTWGAAQLGIAQGVLDAVADGLLPPPTTLSSSSRCGWTPARRRRRRCARPTAQRCAKRSAWRWRAATPRPPALWWRAATRCAAPSTAAG